MRKLEIDWSDLELGWGFGSFEMTHYLDLETGKVVLVTEEISRYLQEPPDDELEDWEQEALEVARQVEEGYGERFIELPRQDSREGYRDMEDFIGTVKRKSVRDRLWRAIDGRRPFRAFKDDLAAHPQEEKRWFAFRDRREREAMLEWLEAQGVEPTNPPELPELPEAEAETPADRREELLEELTLLTLYLSSWQEGPKGGKKAHRAWKGHLFEVLNRLEDKGLISSSRRAKSLHLTDAGVARAQELEERYASE